jgi:hypothetical protein
MSASDSVPSDADDLLPLDDLILTSRCLPAYCIVRLKYREFTTNALIIPNTVSPNEKYDSKNERIVLSLI